ncbi:MAG: head maturation protease, ClpP-related [Brevundimonas sp.]|uniref:head maturation protease, ClpP-related n=1 Tax=Brevundimonas sp. TaxID=1871086 RepID=UPI004034F651
MNKLRRLLASNARRGSFRAEGATLYIYDVIVASDDDAEWMGGVSAESIVKQIRASTGAITLRINSPGGDVFAARAVQAAMDAYDGEIVAYVDGYAASAASLIAVAADRCVMSPGAFLMIHKAWTIGVGNADDMLASAELLEKIDGTLAETYAEKAGGDPADFAEMMRAETWFTAAEALQAGLADEISAKPVKAETAWDLSAYAGAPESAAAPNAKAAADAAPEQACEESAQRARLHAVRMRHPSA